MSWPPWPAAATGPWPGAVAQPAAPGAPYTPEQWAAMQHQNWQQWVQWQQQYQQWQAQYGEQYQKSMTALTGHTPQLPVMSAQPPLPAVDPKIVPPPLPDARPPLPPEEPPSALSALSQPPPPVSFNASVPPPVLQPSKPAAYAHDTNAPQFNAAPPPSLLSLNVPKPGYTDGGYRTEASKRPADFSDHFEDAKKNRWESQPAKAGADQSKPWTAGVPGLKTLHWPANQKLVPQDKPPAQRPNVEELSEAEKNFDKQFEQWEAQFNKWKAQNAGHPDKQQYQEYEAKWESWRAQLLDRREQMRRKRLGIVGPAVQHAAKTSESAVNVHPNKPTAPDRAEEAGVRKLADEPTDMKTGDGGEPAVVLFTQPPKEQRTNIRQRRGSAKSDTECPPLDSGFLATTLSAGGIPGLDLVKDDGENLPENKDDKKADNEIKGPDLEAISKGINSILGDEKLLSMLSMVTQNKKPLEAANNEPNRPDSQASGQRPEGNNAIHDEYSNSYQSNDSFGNQSNVNTEYHQEAYEDHYYNDPYEQPWPGDSGRGDFNRGFAQQQAALNSFEGPSPFNRGSSFNQARNVRGYNNFNQAPNSFSRGPPGPNTFNPGPSGPNSFNQGPYNRGPNNFNSGPMSRGPPGLNSFNQGPPNRGNPGPSNLNQGPANRGPSGPSMFNEDPTNRGPKDYGRGPLGLNSIGQEALNRRPPGPSNLNQGPPNREPGDPNSFNQGPPSREPPEPNSFNQGPPSREASQPNSFNPGALNRVLNDLNQGPMNRGPLGLNTFNPSPLARRANDFNHSNTRSNNFTEGIANRGPPDPSTFTQGSSQNRGSYLNQAPANRSSAAPSYFGQERQSVGPSNFNREPNMRPNSFNGEPNRAPNPGSTSFGSERPGNFHQDLPDAPEDFSGPPFERDPGDFLARGPAPRNSWGSDDMKPTQRYPNRDAWPPFDRRPPIDFDNQDYATLRPNDLDQVSQHSGTTALSDNNCSVRAPHGSLRTVPDGPDERKLDEQMSKGSGDLDKGFSDFELARSMEARFNRWRREEVAPTAGRQFPDLPRYPDRCSQANRDPFPRATNDKYWDEALILKPTTVVDYGHKSLRKTDAFIEPVQTFDYGHTSKSVDPVLREKELKREPPYVKFNKYSDPSYSKKQDVRPSPPRISSFNHNRAFEEEPRPNHDRKLVEARRPYDGSSNRYENKYEKYDRYEERRSSRNYGPQKSYSERFDKYEDRVGCRERQRSNERELKIEQFVNKPNPSDGKADEKVAAVTMIEDLLSPPGRNTRPPRIVIMLRGPPGSGKTFLAKLIKDKEVEQGGSAPRILSLDDYFMVEQDKEMIEKETGRKTVIKEMVYEYEECMEISYRQSLEKAFKKTITDGFFPFIILDCINDKTKHCSDMWSFAKQNGFQVYVCQMELDVASCTKRNIHHRSEIEIERLVAGWEPTPSHYLSLDATSLIQAGSISEVEMEEVPEMDETENEEDETEDQFHVSKWERMEHSGEKLARLDGINKPLRTRTTMEDYLQLDEDEIPEERPGQKRVRWADLEERRRQEKIRAIGFVVGQTDWDRMMDPTQGSSALTQTKYIERVRRF